MKISKKTHADRIRFSGRKLLFPPCSLFCAPLLLKRHTDIFHQEPAFFANSCNSPVFRQTENNLSYIFQRPDNPSRQYKYITFSTAVKSFFIFFSLFFDLSGNFSKKLLRPRRYQHFLQNRYCKCFQQCYIRNRTVNQLQKEIAS